MTRLYYRGKLTAWRLLEVVSADPLLEFNYSGQKSNNRLSPRAVLAFEATLEALVRIVGMVEVAHSFWSEQDTGPRMTGKQAIERLLSLVQEAKPHDSTPLTMWFVGGCDRQSAYTEVLGAMQKNTLTIAPQIDTDRNLIAVSGDTTSVTKLLEYLNWKDCWSESQPRPVTAY